MIGCREFAITENDEKHSRGPKRRAVVFTTDGGFLLPTLVAATQIARQTPVVDIADILIFLVDFSDEEARHVTERFGSYGLRFERMNGKSFSLPADAHFNKTHVPRSTLARLTVGELIASNYNHLIYCDGDVQIVDSILPLVSFDVPEGHILAATDREFLTYNDSDILATKSRDYIRGLGLDNPIDYFNCGVLACTASTWRREFPRALQYFIENSQKCQVHDQSALNAVFAGRRLHLSPAYNFVTGFSEVSAWDYVTPKIIHFTGGGKPWFFSGVPWRGRFRRYYDKMLSEQPWLSRYVVVPDRTAIRRSEWRMAARHWTFRSLKLRTYLARRRRARAYITSTDFAVK